MTSESSPTPVAVGAGRRPRDAYVHGHAESVLRAYRWRTAGNCAAYLLPVLRPGMDLLDVGCGPGTITVDLALAVAPGRAVGIDLSGEALARAAELAEARHADNLVFDTGDVYELGYPDASFDVVHAHQVLQHLSDPVAALREMRRITRPRGVVAVRDADHASMVWYPGSEGLTEWIRVYRAVAAATEARHDAGRHLLGWARQAGFSDVTPSASTWCFATPGERTWWATQWAERFTASAISERAVADGVATRDTLQAIARAWQQWADNDDAWFALLHGEVLARR